MLFPLREICAQFRSGDIVGPDMYLPVAFQEKILRETCHLEPAWLYLSSAGKRSGRVWLEIEPEYAIIEHFGDNEITDIVSPRQRGIAPRHVTVTGRSPVETLLTNAGLVPLANLVREARLRTHHPTQGHRHIQLLQIQLNMPLLILATLELVKQARQRGWQRILFSGRDGFLWNELYLALYPLLDDAPPSFYFFTSRLARMRPSVDYLAYFEELRGAGPTAVVDPAGTGWSLTRLIEHAAPVQTDIFSHPPTRSPVVAGELPGPCAHTRTGCSNRLGPAGNARVR